MTGVPNLFLVGAAKAGTTSLYHLLAQHPDVHAPTIKEPHWTAHDLGLAERWGVADRDDYLALYRPGAAAQYRLDGSPSALLSPSAPGRILDLCPDAHAVIVLRDPVEVVPALHGQLALGGMQVDRDLRRAVDHARQLWGQPLQGLAWEVWTRYFDIVSYDIQVSRYRELWPADRLHVVWFDDLRDDAAESWRVIQERLGLAPVQVDLTPQNLSMRVTSPTIQRVVIGSRMPTALRPFVPRGLTRRVKRAVARRNVRQAPRTPTPPDVRRQLAQDLRPTVRRLELLSGRDLSGWARD